MISISTPSHHECRHLEGLTAGPRPTGPRGNVCPLRLRRREWTAYAVSVDCEPEAPADQRRQPKVNREVVGIVRASRERPVALSATAGQTVRHGARRARTARGPPPGPCSAFAHDDREVHGHRVGVQAKGSPKPAAPRDCHLDGGSVVVASATDRAPHPAENSQNQADDQHDDANRPQDGEFRDQYSCDEEDYAQGDHRSS
jgi:hypothetical protein